MCFFGLFCFSGDFFGILGFTKISFNKNLGFWKANPS